MIRDLFRNFIKNTARVFTGKNLWWHALAIALTVVLVLSDADWWFYEHTRSSAYYPLVYVAGIGGFFVPVLVPLCIYLVGEARRSAHLQKIGAGMAQAEVIAFLVTCLYKIFTGRTQPAFLGPASSIDISKQFHFGFFQNGIFWGWPSSHAAVAFAGTTVLVLLWRNKSAAFAAILWTLIVASGAAIGFHWLSDVVAGTIMGILTGTIVARNFQRHSR